MDQMVAFGELISSNNLGSIVTHGFSLINHFYSLGVYEQGIPIRNTTDFIWGTNAGIRTFPIIFWLFILEKLFSSNWIYVYLWISLLLPFITFFFAHRLLKQTDLFSIIAALFYGGNVWIINRIFTGFWQLNIVYAFLPFLVCIPLKISIYKHISLEKTLFYVSLYAISASIILVAQPHFLVMVCIFSLIHILYLLLKKHYIAIKLLLRFYLQSVIVFLLINVYFFVPGLLYPEHIFTAPNQYFSLASVAFNGQGAQIENVVRFAIAFPFMPYTWTWQEYVQLLPFLTIVLLFIINHRRKWYFGITLFLFLFLAKGLHDPGKDISAWLYQNIFFLHFFRDPSRFIAAIVLIGSLIIADYSVKKHLSTIVKVPILVGFIILLFVTNIKSFDQKQLEILEPTKIPHSYNDLQTFVQNELSAQNERMLTIPNTGSLSLYSWYNNPSPTTAHVPFDMLTPISIPLANSSNFPDNYSNQLSAFLYQEFNKTYDEKILKPLAVQYILIDESVTKAPIEKAVAKRAADALARKPQNYQKIFSKEFLTIYKVKSTAHMFTDQEPVFAIGDLNTIKKHYTLGSNRPIILLNQSLNSQQAQSPYIKSNDIVIDSEKPVLTLTAEKLSQQYAIDILGEGWNYDKLFGNSEPYKMRYILQNGQLFTSGRAVASPARTGFMHIPHKLTSGKYKVLIKALTDSEQANLLIQRDYEKGLDVSIQNKLQWIDAGNINVDKNQSFITITKTDSNPIVIDYLLFVPEAVWRDSEKNIKAIIKTMRPYKAGSGNDKPNIPSKLIGSDTVVSEKPVENQTVRLSYGEYWQGNMPSEKFISDGYGMSFFAKNKGLSNITYLPNKIFIPLSVASIFFHGVLIIYICYFLIKYSRRTFLKK